MQFKFARQALVLGLLATFACAASAQGSQKEITAGNIATFPPYAFKDPNTGEFTVLDRDLFEAMAKKIGATVKWEFFSGTDMMSFAPLKTGRVDIYGGGGISGFPQRREQGVSFIDFIYDPFVFYTLKSKAGELKTPEATCGKRVAVFRGNAVLDIGIAKWNDEVCTRSGKPAMCGWRLMGEHRPRS